MPDRPQFVDNRERTLAEAIGAVVDYYRGETGHEPTLDIATGYFDPNGYAAVSGALDDVAGVRLLLGAEPDEKDRTEWDAPGAARGADYDAERVDTALARLDEDLRADRDLLGFSRETDDTLRGLLDFLDREDVAVRRYEDGFLHGKAYLFDGERGVLAGSSNFTGAGLTANMELNLGAYDPRVTDDVGSWFEELWAAATPYDLAGVYEERFEAYDPYLIYLRFLYERYGDRLEEASPGEDGEIELTNFQRHGARRAMRFLERHDGVIVGDEVGLGKTYIAGKLLEEYVQNRRQHALVVAPAYLRDGMWKNVREEWGLRFDVLSYAQLRQEPKLDPERELGTSEETNLDLAVDDYQLVVVDEGHAFRNPQTKQSAALRRLLRGTPPKDLVLVTATPVNNSLWDLYYLLSYFVDNDAAFADDGIRSLRERFKTAQSRDPSNLSPDLLFDVLDQTTVRRTRRFVQDRYENSTLPDGNGGEIHITFPEPDPRRVDYSFEETFGDDFFGSIRRGLGGRGDDDPELALARYQPRTVLEDEADESELSLVGLLRTGLLKRFESSSHAFANTLERMIDQYKSAVDILEAGYVPETDAIEEWSEADSDEAFEEAFDRTAGASLVELDDTHDEGRLWEQLQADLTKLESWHDTAVEIDRGDDEKLATLHETLAEIARGAGREGVDAADTRQKRKVVIFSYFQDTVEWIVKSLREAAQNDERLAPYRDRIAAVSGDGLDGEVSQTEAIQGFAPESTGAPTGTEDRFDVLVTTDVLGQGVNLQQARNVVNYDLPWNPMRVVQRNGRIDRIGSPHDTVRPHTFFPEDRVDEFLQLEDRVRQKLTQAAQSVGLDSQVIPDVETRAQNFADRRAEIEAMQDERPDQFRSRNSSTEAAAFSGEEFRQLLRDGVDRRGDEIEGLPWGAGSGLRGDTPGYVFCARVGDEEFLRFVPADDEGVVTDSLACLRRAECDPETERHLPESMRSNVYDAWDRARESVHEEWSGQTDPRDVQPSVPKVLRQVNDHLVEHPPSGLTQSELETVTRSVRAPLGRRYQREFREIYRDDTLDDQEKSARFVEKTRELGLQPFDQPEPREPIEETEIKLVCWLAITPRELDDELSHGLLTQRTLD
jgi:hypothetical protein